jgi:hypothetical protein
MKAEAQQPGQAHVPLGPPFPPQCLDCLSRHKHCSTSVGKKHQAPASSWAAAVTAASNSDTESAPAAVCFASGTLLWMKAYECNVQCGSLQWQWSRHSESVQALVIDHTGRCRGFCVRLEGGGGLRLVIRCVGLSFTGEGGGFRINGHSRGSNIS